MTKTTEVALDSSVPLDDGSNAGYDRTESIPLSCQPRGVTETEINPIEYQQLTASNLGCDQFITPETARRPGCVQIAEPVTGQTNNTFVSPSSPKPKPEKTSIKCAAWKVVLIAVVLSFIICILIAAVLWLALNCQQGKFNIHINNYVYINQICLLF